MPRCIVIAPHLLAWLLTSSPAAAQTDVLRPANNSFEEGEQGWWFPEGCMGTV